MLDRLRHNFGLKVLSLALAIGAWAYLRFAANPIITAHFEQQLIVPITTTGLASDMVARFTEHQAAIGVVVPRGGNVRPEMMRAVLDLEGKNPGVYNVALQVIAPKLEIRSLSPANVTLAIERVERRAFPIAIRYGDIPRGIVVDHVSVEPSAVLLRGATSDLARVVSVRVELPLGPVHAAVDAMLRPLPVDAHGAEVPAVDFAPNLVRVRAAFVQTNGEAK